MIDEPAHDSQQPLVSVVIPTHERPELLREAARSVAAQTYDRIELIVVDDNSATPARRALSDARLDSLVSVHHARHSENRGASAARNTGIQAASGEYVAFLDDDDCWKEEKIAAQVRAFRRADERVGVVYTGIEHVASGQSTVEVPELRGDIARELLVGKSLAPTSTVMIRRDSLQAVGGFDEELPSWNDRDLYLRLSRHCEFQPVTEPLTVRRSKHDTDQLSSDYETKRDVTYPRFVSKHRSAAARYGRRCERRFLSSASLMLGMAAQKNGRYLEARKHYVRSIRRYPFDSELYLQLLPVLGGRYTYRPAEFVYRAAKRLARRAQGQRASQR